MYSLIVSDSITAVTDTDTTTYNIIPVTETSQSIANGAAVFVLFPDELSIQSDDEGSRTISDHGNTFILQHQVNDFAGIK